ncbi:MAG TPA: hypothetical protein VFK47_06400, partial [Ktedonobacteraceae bacterium]|nr:hypothetical protein [Ktedonobacteraceae bacterium]
LRFLAATVRTDPNFRLARAWQNKPLKRMTTFRAFQHHNWHHTPLVEKSVGGLINPISGECRSW